MATTDVSRGSRGFTLVEALVVMAMIGLVVLLGMPALMNSIHRARQEAAVRDVASAVRAARIEAIRHSAPVYVHADFDNHQFAIYRESAPGAGFNPLSPGDSTLVRASPLPSRIHFWGPGDADPKGPDAVAGFDGEPYAVLTERGSAQEGGAFRFGDRRGNFLEVRIDPPATARVSIRKYATDGTWREQGEDGKNWKWN